MKKTLAPLLVISLFAILIIAVSSTSRAGLLQIESSYISKGESTPSLHVAKGTGFLIGLDCQDLHTNDFLSADPNLLNSCKKNFVVTAAHASQGSKNLKILHELQYNIQNYNESYKVNLTDSIPILGRLADTWNDLEIIELDTQALIEKTIIQPLLRCIYQKSDEEFLCQNNFSPSEINSNLMSFHFNSKSPYFRTPYINFGEVVTGIESPHWKSLDFIALSPFADPSPPNQNYINFFYRWAYENNKVILPESIFRGMSGAPLLASPTTGGLDIDSRTKTLVGIGIQSEFDFHESIFASHHALTKLLTQYLSLSNANEKIPKKTEPISPELHYNQGTFRTLKAENFKLSEKLAQQKNVCGGSCTSDVTQGEKAESDEVIYDTDLLRINQKDKTFQRVLAISYMATTEGFLGLSSPSNVWDHPRYVWASMPAIHSMLKKYKNLETLDKNLLLDNSNLIGILKDKLKINEKKINEKSSINKWPSKGFDICKVTINQNQSNEINVTLTKRSEPNDSLRLTLNEYGHFVETTKEKKQISSSFKPRARVTSDQNENFIVDIRQLFFTDLYEIPSQTEKGFKNTPELKEILESSGAKIKFRKIDANGNESVDIKNGPKTKTINCYESKE